jgi:chemosensory pili system protein ChpA (sensor histidine kinase/response regulator)
MKTEDTVEYNSLRWVKKELDLILNEAQVALSAYIEDNDEPDRLSECIDHLHMVQGILQMVELYGAAQLAEEMEQVASTVLNGKINKVEDAYDVLMRSMLQLPDYLESLQAGNRDVPMVLLPLLNDLRASRNASLLSENVLFFPDIDSQEGAAENEAATDVASGQLLPLAKKLRPHYQIGLLGWFKGQKTRSSLKRILAVLTELEKKSSTQAARRLWNISAALTEGLAVEGLDSNVSVKMLLGQVDRNIKQLIDHGEESFSEKVPSELLKNLLYYVARVEKESQRVVQVKETYRLNELLPDSAKLEEVQAGLGGLNTELLQTVSQGIREDLLEVKDTLEIFVHGESNDVSGLSSLPELLNKIADTLAMLGLGGTREQVLSQREKINEFIEGKLNASDEEVMDVASELLSVEAQLNDFIANRSNVDDDEEGKSRRVGDLGDMPESEYLEVLSAVIREALQDFSDARQAILGYLENTDDKDLLKLVLKRLDEVSGAMFMLPIKRLESQIDAIKDYVSKVLLGAEKVPEQQEQDDLADVITSVEYYLEAILEGRPDLELSLNSGEAAAKKLDDISSSFSDFAEDESIEEVTAVEIEPVTNEEFLVDELPVADEVSVTEIEPELEVESEAKEESVVEETEGYPQYVILGDDADEEILEIFIEEALEELASLNEHLPRWINDSNDEESLMTIRRSFHTLKGSGRLIGAELIGEFSWHFENMLNRVIDKSRPLTQDVYDVLEESLGVLPQLIEQLKGNQEPIKNVYQLMGKAETLGKWQKPTDEAEDETEIEEAEAEAEEIEALIDTDDFTELEADEPELLEEPDELLIQEEGASFDSDEIELDVSEVNDSVELELEESIEESIELDTSIDSETEVEVTQEVTEVKDDAGLEEFSITDESDEEAEDDFDIDLTEDLEALQMAISPDEELLFEEEPVEEAVVELEISEEDTDNDSIVEEILVSDTDITAFDSEATLEIHIDPILFGIFKGETESHLKVISDLLDQHYRGDEKLLASPELIRALHTLFGSARTAEVEEIAELCGALEKYVRLQQEEQSTEISEDGVKLIADVCLVVTSMLEQLANPAKRLHSDKALHERIQLMNTALANAQSASDGDSAATINNEESLVSYSEVDEELVDIFLEEAEELLDGCENSLQRWNNDNDDVESVNDLQRHLHTLKGGARMADLAPIGDLTHVLESLIISVNDGKVNFSRGLSSILHESMDRLSDMLAKVKVREPVSSANELINHLESLRRGESIDSASEESPSSDEEDPEPEIEAELEISEDDLLDAATVEDINDSVLLEIEGSIQDNDDLDATFAIEISEDALSLKDEDESDDVSSELIIEDTDELIPDETPEYNAEESIEIVDDTIVEEVDIDEATEEVIQLSSDEDDATDQIVIQSPVEEKPTDTKDSGKSTFVLSKEENASSDEDSPAKGIAHEQVRVRSDLLNDLVNHAGEVSVYHARMGQQVTNFSFNLSEMDQTVIRLREQLRKLSIETEAQILSRYEKESDQYDEHFDPLEMDRFSTMQQISRSLQETVGDIESIKGILSDDIRDSETLLLQESRVSTELQEGLMRTRMVHFGGLQSRLRRIIRQTARELNKEVELVITGETSEVDRTVLDRIVAPLEHMLRNAVSHGIEIPEDRIAAGKSEIGTISISVDSDGGDVMIRVVDDGRGIDIGAVRNRATEKGLIDSESKLSDHDILQFIMEAGFSTAEKVTQISGRGVGMDVVDSEIKQLGGVLEIDTVQGQGTTFTIRLPLTLAINHALLVHANDDIYAVPLNSIEGVVRLSGPELQAFYDSDDNTYEFAGTSYELKHLGYLLTGRQINYSNNTQLYPVLLAHVGDQRVALHVDDLLGRREIVVKPLGAQVSTVRGISGATILGDGRVVLILEMNVLVLGDALFHVAIESDVDQPIEEVVVEVEELVVMVVDDSITIRKVTERMLARHNLKVVTAKDGVDAVAQLQDMKPDVMLLDIEMPRMDGYEVATHVRNDERLKDLPIIMITSRTGDKHRDKAMEIGVNKYMGKPFQEEELMENINELIGS